MHPLKSQPKGKLIAVEGLEGSGKSSAIATIVDCLSQHQIRTQVTREPGGTALGEVLRDTLKDIVFRDVLDPRTELLLMYASRVQLVEEVIRPLLAQGVWIIVDRFELSTRAYQGGGRGLSQQMIDELSSFCLQGLKPDLTLYFDIEPELGMQRAKQRGQYDRIEQEHMDFFHRAHQAYLNWVRADESIYCIDAALPFEEVQACVRKVVSDFAMI